MKEGNPTPSISLSRQQHLRAQKLYRDRTAWWNVRSISYIETKKEREISKYTKVVTSLLLPRKLNNCVDGVMMELNTTWEFLLFSLKINPFLSLIKY